MDTHQLLKEIEGCSLALDERISQSIRLAAMLQEEANRKESWGEKLYLGELARMMHDPVGKVFTTELTDQAFRSSNSSRVASQINFLIKKYGIPEYLHGIARWGLYAFEFLSDRLAFVLAPLAKAVIQQATSRVILPEEPQRLKKHLDQRIKQGVRINLNHLGEAILGEKEAEMRLETYLQDLKSHEIDYISVKISTLYSQINLLAWDDTLEKLAEKLRTLLRAAQGKFINLDMEEYKDLHLTVALFKKVLDEESFLHTSAGIVLQSYLPDAFHFLQDLTEFALSRLKRGGAPIKIRLVKGANLAMERVEAQQKGWQQAPFEHKWEADANFKRMLDAALRPENTPAVKIGVGSHNLFDIAYAMVLSSERKVAASVTFEMLEGMAEPLRRVVQEVSGDMLLYCPVATKTSFHNAVAYLVRRLDENTGHDHFLRVAFGLTPGTSTWQHQANLFAHACDNQHKIASSSRRNQNRYHAESPTLNQFKNEPDTDWSLPINQLWAQDILEKWTQRILDPIPLVVGNNEYCQNPLVRGIDPSQPSQELFRYQQATPQDIELCLQTATLCQNSSMAHCLNQVANLMRKHRGDLIGAMLINTGKPIPEGDAEVSEAIDFCEYYRFSLETLSSFSDLSFSPKGVVLVASPWNFSCSIPAGGIAAALAAGNAVIFKPAPEAVLVGYELVKLFWEAGVPRSQLQFLLCTDELASSLVKDSRLDAIVLTGATATAKQLLKLRPGLDLMAETGGKNSIIVTAMADRDLAVKDIVQSAFSYAGQKCSACSVLILEEEVYKDPLFKKQLKDATQSLRVGSARNPSSKINPLIYPPGNALKKALSSLEEGEEWLLKPELNQENPHLLSPGIKWGVRPGSFIQQTELFGPLLAVICATDLTEAINIANSTSYGLTAGLHSLDEREHTYWLQHIQAGNCYINRTITGAIVERQPFGGTKASSFGPGAKAGGPNYLKQFLHFEQRSLPQEKAGSSCLVQPFLEKIKAHPNFDLIQLSASNYSFYWKHFFSQDHDPMKILGQKNIQRYRPYSSIELRIVAEDKEEDWLRVILACMITLTPLTISITENTQLSDLGIDHYIESDQEFINRISQLDFPRLRLLSIPSADVVQALSEIGIPCVPTKVLANGRFELLHYLREISISYDYHRYGNLGAEVE